MNPELYWLFALVLLIAIIHGNALKQISDKLDGLDRRYLKPRDGRPCEAKQYSDQMSCARCNKAWDINDPRPPYCDP